MLNGKPKRETIRKKQDRLGRGLDVLLGPSTEKDQVLLLDIERVYPDKGQPRKNFDKEALEKLCASIKSQGLLQPILVQESEKDYQIIAGERRWRAACMAGLHKIPAIVKSPKAEQKALWALIENIQREELNPIEEARAFKKIIKEKGLSQEFLAQMLGRSRPSLANTLRLLQLDKEVQKLVESKALSFAQARELLRFKSPEEQRKVARTCVKKSLTVKRLNLKASKRGLKKSFPYWLKSILSQLEKSFSKKVRLDYSKGKGRLTFSFQNDRELKGLLDKLLR